MKQTLSATEFFELFPVSRETEQKLRRYAEMLLTWQAKMNLVGPATLPDLWRRHMLDSAQLFPLLPDGPILDIGSGAGFPAMVLSILGAADVHLVDSDSRKCAFLREVARVTESPAKIHNIRVEQLPSFPVAAVTARALAKIDDLLELAAPFLLPGTECLFLKGETLEDELTIAAKNWKMSLDRIPSRSDPNGIILRVKEVHRGRQQG